MLASRAKPDWLKIRPPEEKFFALKDRFKEKKLVTVCEEARCPNMSECWSGGTATFMVMGDTCTRACKFCAVKTGFTKKPPDSNEPEEVAQAVKKMMLDYVVLTSVDRDDLPDQGAKHFADCIRFVKNINASTKVEVLIPDFGGDMDCIRAVVDAAPDVIGHNIETVRRLQPVVRDPRAGYEQSLSVLATVKKMNSRIYTKSSVMLGFGEAEEEVIQTMKDLREINTDFLTIGQYLCPSQRHLSVLEYIHPEKFEVYRRKGLDLGFIYVASGPFVRSSFRAGEFFMKSLREKSIE
jgi:lipoic acid synthetase